MNPGAVSVPVAGQVLDGKFRVERVLGQGGMGVVVAATHLVLGKRVALKFLLPEAAAHPEIKERFLREARAASSLHNEHIAKVMDVGTMTSGSPYMVMEFLSGHDLAQEIERRGRIPVDDAASYLLQACEGLAEAHAAGITHRDLKPSNLFLAEQPDGTSLVKVLDFGIAKVTAPGSAQLTSTTGMMGSPLYMAPEQMSRPKSVDPRSDLWALGVTLYELLTGAWPFEGETIHTLSAAILTQPPIPLRARCPELPVELEAIVTSCLQRDPDQRMPSLAALAAALAPFTADPVARLSVDRVQRLQSRRASRASLASVEAPLLPAEAPVPEAPTGPPIPTQGSWSASEGKGLPPVDAPRSRWKPIALGAGLLVGLPLAGWLALRPSSAPSAPSSAAPALSSAPLPVAASSPEPPAASVVPTAVAVVSAAPAMVSASASAVTRPAGGNLPNRGNASPPKPPAKGKTVYDD